MSQNPLRRPAPGDDATVFVPRSVNAIFTNLFAMLNAGGAEIVLPKGATDALANDQSPGSLSADSSFPITMPRRYEGARNSSNELALSALSPGGPDSVLSATLAIIFPDPETAAPTREAIVEANINAPAHLLWTPGLPDVFAQCNTIGEFVSSFAGVNANLASRLSYVARLRPEINIHDGQVEVTRFLASAYNVGFPTDREAYAWSQRFAIVTALIHAKQGQVFRASLWRAAPPDLVSFDPETQTWTPEWVFDVGQLTYDPVHVRSTPLSEYKDLFVVSTLAWATSWYHLPWVEMSAAAFPTQSASREWWGIGHAATFVAEFDLICAVFHFQTWYIVLYALLIPMIYECPALLYVMRSPDRAVFEDFMNLPVHPLTAAICEQLTATATGPSTYADNTLFFSLPFKLTGQAKRGRRGLEIPAMFSDLEEAKEWMTATFRGIMYDLSGSLLSQATGSNYAPSWAGGAGAPTFRVIMNKVAQSCGWKAVPRKTTMFVPVSSVTTFGHVGYTSVGRDNKPLPNASPLSIGVLDFKPSNSTEHRDTNTVIQVPRSTKAVTIFFRNKAADRLWSDSPAGLEGAMQIVPRAMLREEVPSGMNSVVNAVTLNTRLGLTNAVANRYVFPDDPAQSYLLFAGLPGCSLDEAQTGDPHESGVVLTRSPFIQSDGMEDIATFLPMLEATEEVISRVIGPSLDAFNVPTGAAPGGKGLLFPLIISSPAAWCEALATVAEEHTELEPFEIAATFGEVFQVVNGEDAGRDTYTPGCELLPANMMLYPTRITPEWVVDEALLNWWGLIEVPDDQAASLPSSEIEPGIRLLPFNSRDQVFATQNVLLFGAPEYHIDASYPAGGNFTDTAATLCATLQLAPTLGENPAALNPTAVAPPPINT